MQNTSHILMIKPAVFAFNTETAANNSFQKMSGNSNETAQKALQEFDDFVQKLLQHGVDVIVWEDKPEPATPDAIFPNNWISFHEEGICCLYPMFAENRRQERDNGIIELLKNQFIVNEIIDFTAYEKDLIYNEGTGSMVLDRENKIAYACLSPRTHATAIYEFCDKMSYTAVVFNAYDILHQPIYHTNVMMSVADEYVIVCIESISNDDERKFVRKAIDLSDKKIIEISLEQMNHFAGNMLQVMNDKGEKILVMSQQAYNILTPQQIDKLQQYNTLLPVNLQTIETNGGGSARCMMAEIFLPVK
jgi:hypothetical protein